MNTYRATARRWELGWEVHIDGEGVTQSRTLASAPTVAAEYLATLYGGEVEDYHVEVEPELSPEIAHLQKEAAAKRRDAEELSKSSALLHRQTVRLLREQKLSYDDIAAVLHVSKTRVQQLVSEAASL